MQLLVTGTGREYLPAIACNGQYRIVKHLSLWLPLFRPLLNLVENGSGYAKSVSITRKTMERTAYWHSSMPYIVTVDFIGLL